MLFLLLLNRSKQTNCFFYIYLHSSALYTTAYILSLLNRRLKRMDRNLSGRSDRMEENEDTWYDPDFYMDSGKNEGVTCWKTNLMLRDEVARVKERGKDFKRRTSFEDNLINQHVEQMLKAVRSTDLKMRQIELPKSDWKFLKLRTTKQIEGINSNSYLTEDQKWEFTGCILENQQNFSIFFRFSPVFQENKDELLYLLTKILHFCSLELDITVKYNTSQDSILEILENNRLKLVDRILNQEIVKVVNPIFFSNVNEEPLMRIVDSWFYHVLCVKQGLYGIDFEEEGETKFLEENLFLD